MMSEEHVGVSLVRDGELLFTIGLDVEFIEGCFADIEAGCEIADVEDEDRIEHVQKAVELLVKLHDASGDFAEDQLDDVYATAGRVVYVAFDGVLEQADDISGVHVTVDHGVMRFISFPSSDDHQQHVAKLDPKWAKEVLQREAEQLGATTAGSRMVH